MRADRALQRASASGGISWDQHPAAAAVLLPRLLSAQRLAHFSLGPTGPALLQVRPSTTMVDVAKLVYGVPEKVVHRPGSKNTLQAPFLEEVDVEHQEGAYHPSLQGNPKRNIHLPCWPPATAHVCSVKGCLCGKVGGQTFFSHCCGVVIYPPNHLRNRLHRPTSFLLVSGDAAQSMPVAPNDAFSKCFTRHRG
jgi:hypothetical protein